MWKRFDEENVFDSTPTEVKMRNPEQQFVLHGQDIPLVVYMIQLGHIMTGQTALDLAKKYTTQSRHFMTAEDLHCTVHVSQGLDEDYEKDFYRQTGDTHSTLTVKNLYCSKTRAVCSVELHSEQMHLFTGHTPHVSIARDDTDECKDMQSWLNMVLSDDVGSQWVLVEDKVRFNPILEVYEISWWHVWSVFKTAWMRESVEECMLVSDSIAADLERIPDILWSKGPTDVGRLNVPPYCITTATNTKPQLRQYPISGGRGQ